MLRVTKTIQDFWQTRSCIFHNNYTTWNDTKSNTKKGFRNMENLLRRIKARVRLVRIQRRFDQIGFHVYHRFILDYTGLQESWPVHETHDKHFPLKPNGKSIPELDLGARLTRLIKCIRVATMGTNSFPLYNISINC